MKTAKFKISGLLLSFMAIFFAGCAASSTESPSSEGDLTAFTVTLPAPQSVSTRGAGTADENHIATLDLLLFDTGASGTLQRVVPCTDLVASNGGVNWSFKASIPYRADDYDLVFVANARTQVAALTTGSTGDTQSTAQSSLTYSKTDKWDVSTSSPIPMYGKLPDQTIADNTYTAPAVSLRRMLVRVNVSIALAAQPDFQLSDVYVFGYNTAGSIISAAAPSIPASPGPAAASSPLAYTAASIAAASNQIYLFERAAGVLYPADGWVDSPCIVVGGSYKTGAKSWYRLDFASTGSTPSPLALIRNHSYNFTITGVTGSGYGSAESARTSLPANMTGEVVSWDENDLSAPITGRLYNITVNSTAGGTALAKYSKAPAGTQITVLASPSSGKVFDGWASISSDGDAISPAPATAASNNPLSFTMPAGNVTVVPKWADANNTNFLLVTPDAKTFAAGDVTPFSFAVTSDVDWSVAEKSDATNHFTVSGVTGNTPPPTGGTGGFTVTPAASDRGDISHTATFTVSGGGQSRDVTVTHDAPARVFSVARTDGDTSSWGFLHGSSVAKSITVTANVGWTATLVNSPGFTLSPSPEGTSTGSFTVSPTGPNDVETPRTATISITGAGAPGDSSTTETITITQAAYSATSDNIIYVVGTGDDAYLSLGSWGNEIDETNYTEKMAFFKWGSVVAFDLVDAHRSFYSNPDIANNAITFNPTTRSFSTYAEIPHTNSIYATSLEAATLNGVRFWGQGDPCQLIGLTVRQIREATDEANFSELLASRAYGYQGWVMPTRQQALYFIYGSDPVIALNPSISNDYVEVHSGNGTIDSPTVLKFKAPTGNGNDAFAGNGTLLPAAGGRQDTGAIASYGNDAVYWTSSSDGGSSGIGLNISSTQARVQSRSRWVGNVVRCIRP